MRTLRIMIGMTMTAAVAGATALTPTAATAHEQGGTLERVRVLDDCDPASFNAVIGEGTCVGDGDTTFADFIAEVQATGAAKDWAFKPTDVDLARGEGLHAVSRGGEFHTFTEVAHFGGGCVEELNGGQATVPECTPEAFQTTGLPTGASLDVTGLAPGTHRFQCLIHPWMRTVVVVGDHD